MCRNGQLKEYVAAGTTKEEFVKRLGGALNISPPATSTAAQGSSPEVIPAPHSTIGDRPVPAAAAPQQSHLTAALSRTTTDETANDDLYGGRSSPSSAPARPDAEQPSKEAKGKGKAKFNSDNDAKSKSTGAESNHAAQLRKRKEDERDERQRILKRIEDDKRDRKEREAKERQARLLSNANRAQDEFPQELKATATMTKPRVSIGSGGDFCNLQVRLFDGSTLRQRFPSSGTLKDDVRKWVDTDRTDGDSPYTFRIVMTPLPNRVIDSTEESKTLVDLGLAPSATLVLVPVVRFASAYSGRGSGGIRGILAYVQALLYSFFTGLFSPLALIFSRGGGAVSSGRQEEVSLENVDGAGSAAPNRRIRGFQNNDDRRRDQQLYNGNSVSYSFHDSEDACCPT
jgi:hypothetical protein